MKKIFIMLSLLFIAVMLFGCQGKTDNSTFNQTTLPPQEYNKTFTLQGKIMDAVTGAPIGNDATGTVTMFLIQGDADRGPTKLHTDPNDPLVGEYSFSGIPADLSTAPGEAVFKVVVSRQGYQDFAANINFDAGNPGGFGAFANNGTLNMIGNIYLFPIGSAPGDVQITVLSDHLVPVPNATVLLQQDVFNNGAVAITSSNNGVDTNRLVAAGGLNTSMTATTDANGVATFSGANLVLGGSYIAAAQAINFQGDQLATTKTAAFIIGTNSSTRTINMTGITTFFATSASNQVPGTITPSGALSVTFNEPIALSTTFFTATLNSVVTGTVTSPVVAVLSNNNQTITLTPTFTANPTGAGASISYSYPGGETIILQNTQTVAQCNDPILGLAPCTLFSGGPRDVVNSFTGNPVSGTVQLIAN